MQNPTIRLKKFEPHGARLPESIPRQSRQRSVFRQALSSGDSPSFSDGVETVTESGKAAFLQTAIFLMFLAHFAVANACKTSQAKFVLVYLF